MDLVNREI